MAQVNGACWTAVMMLLVTAHTQHRTHGVFSCVCSVGQCCEIGGLHGVLLGKACSHAATC